MKWASNKYCIHILQQNLSSLFTLNIIIKSATPFVKTNFGSACFLLNKVHYQTFLMACLSHTYETTKNSFLIFLYQRRFLTSLNRTCHKMLRNQGSDRIEPKTASSLYELCQFNILIQHNKKFIAGNTLNIASYSLFPLPSQHS